MGKLGRVTAGVLLSVMLLAGCASKPTDTPATGGTKAEAPKFPTKNIEIIVPFAAGGGTDIVTRAIANAAQSKLGQPVVVVNKTGGGGAVGMGEGAAAKADGYTLTTITVELVTLPHLGLAPIDNSKFEPILMMNRAASAITVPVDAPYKDLKEFLDYAKANPGKVKVGNSGPGAIWHLAAAALEKQADVKFNHIPFNGANPAVTALLGGNVDAVTVSPGEVLTHVQAGKLKILGVMDSQRSPIAPDAPTLKEAGYDVNVATWRGLAAPKGTPQEVLTVLHDAFKAAMETAEFKDFMDKNGLEITYMNGADYAKSMQTENEMFKTLITELGLKQ